MSNAGANSAKVLDAASAAAAVIVASGRPHRFFGARIFCAANPISTTATGKGKSPAPIIVIPGPNGMTIASEDLEALDEFERLLTRATDGSVTRPVAIFYLMHAKAQAVAEEIDKILSGGASNPEGSSAKGTNALRSGALATGPIKITPETRLNALLVQANRADQDTVEQLLKILDLRESPEEIAVSPKPRMISIEYARAKDIADVIRQVYADRLVVAQSQTQRGRRGGMALLMRGMMGGGRDQGQNQSDPATRISIGVDTRTNSLVIVAADPLFEEVKLLAHQLDTANAEENETVRMVTLHRTGAAAVERALTAFAGDAVQANKSNSNSPATNGSTNTTSTLPPWASRGYGRMPGGQPSTGNNRPFGGGSSRSQGFGGQRGSRYSQSGRPGQ